MGDKFNYFGIKAKIRKQLEKEGYIVKEKYEEEPKLPIHLYCTKNEGKLKEELLLFQIVTAGEISENLIKRLRCYQLMIHPALKVTLIISSEITIKKKNKSELKKAGIGLWKINKDWTIDRSLLEPRSIRQHIQNKFKDDFFGKESSELSKRMKHNLSEEDVNEISEAVGKSADLSIVESTRLVLEDPPANIGQSNLDVQCMRLISELKKIKYSDKIKKLTEEYFSLNPEDYEFALRWTRELWKECLDLSYPDIHKDMDPVLQKLFPEYRDHFLHQFQVFLLGLIILDKLIEKNKLKKEISENVQNSWLLASTFHDFAYSLQLYNRWSSTFLAEFLKIKESKKLGLLELDRIYLDESFSSSIEFLITKLDESFDNNKQNHIDLLNKLRLFFLGMISQKKDHGLLSSMSLLKIAKRKGIETTDKKFSEIILPASFAIAIHNDDIWKILHGKYEEEKYKKEMEENRKKWVEEAADLKCLPSLFFDKYPVAFLLIFCDSIQEWGRSQKSKEVRDAQEEANIQVKNITIASERVTVNLFASRTRKSSTFLTNKLKEFEGLENFLKSPNLSFDIRFFDRKDDKEMEDLQIEIKGK